MKLTSSKLHDKKALWQSKLAHRFEDSELKRKSIPYRDNSKTNLSRTYKYRSNLQRRQENTPSLLLLRTQGIAYKKKILENIQQRTQLLDFWSGKWNKQLLIHPESLKHLSRFIEYRIQTTQRLLAATKAIEYHTDSVVAWLFYQWLILAKNKRNQPTPQQLPSWLKLEFCSVMNLASHVPMLLEKSAKKLTQDIFTEDSEVFKSELNNLKADFSKALTEGLLNACLDEDAQKIIFQRAPSHTQIQELFTTTNLLIEFGNHLGLWDLCFINSVILPFHDTNPFADENEWKRALRFEKTLSSIEIAHEQHCKDLDFLHSRVITSLMIDSYILEETLLKSVIESLNTPNLLQRIGQQIVIWHSPNGKQSRLVFISTTTEIFYRQYLLACRNQKKPFGLALKFPQDTFYKAIGFSKHTAKLDTFKSWKHSIKAYLQLKGYLGGMGLSYVTGEIQSHALLPKVLSRMFNISANIEEVPIHAENLPDHGRLPRSYLWTKLRSALDIKHIKHSEKYDVRQGIKLHIQRLIENPLFLVNEQLVARYALARIDKSQGKDPLSPSTILGHIDAFGLAIILSAEDFPILEAASSQRQTIYLNATEIKDINPKRFLYFLKLFEDWLIEKSAEIGAPTPITAIPDYEEIFGDIKRPGFSVDANVLSFDEYEQAKNLLIEAYLDSKGNRIEFLQATILLILGFKMDLRRSEGIYLHTKDYIFDPEEPNLFVKPHEKRKLKTNNANRMYHLEEHLTTQEIKMVNEYLGTIERKLQTQKSTFLFPDKKTTLCPPDRILKPLLKTLREVSIDNDFKFHNLRHSKASWDMLAIFNAQFDLKLENTIFKHLPETAKFLAEARTRWSKAVHTPESFHKAPFYLHRQMGHGSLTTTLKNYIHTMDFAIAGLQKRHSDQVISIAWASQLGVVKKSMLYKEMSGKESSLQNYLLEKILPWSTLTKVEIEEPCQNIEQSETLEKTEASKQNTMSATALLPRLELRRWKAFCLFEIFHFFIEDNKTEYQQSLQNIGLTTADLPKVLEHFIYHKQARIKMPSHDASFKRLIIEFLKLPINWQQTILEGNFHKEGTFEQERKLISQTISRMSVKMDNPKNPLSLVKEIDIICNHPDEAKPVIELIRALDWKIESRFMNPKNFSVSWRDWQSSLALTQIEFNEKFVVKAQVNNSHGRMTIRLKRNGDSEAKHFEQYLLLILLSLT